MPVRFDHADDRAITEELKRHRPIVERRSDEAGTEILCACGATFGPVPKAESALDAFTDHFLRALKGSAA